MGSQMMWREKQGCGGEGVGVNHSRLCKGMAKTRFSSEGNKLQQKGLSQGSPMLRFVC